MLDGNKVHYLDSSIELYELCKTFHKLPSELYAESAEDIELLLIVHNAINSHEQKEDKKRTHKEGRERLKQQYGGGGR